MRFTRITKNIQNMETAINQYLNSSKSSYEIEKEYNICRRTLFYRLKNIREKNERNNNSSIEKNNNDKINIKKTKKTKKNDKISINLIGGKNDISIINENDNEKEKEYEKENINENIKNKYAIKINDNKYKKKYLSIDEYKEYINRGEILMTIEDYEKEKINKINELNTRVKLFINNNKNQ